jgi:hypothetical protein
MTRRAFNGTFAVYKGPGTATPGLHVGNFLGRLVEADGIILSGPGAPLNLAWITMDAYDPIGAWTPLVFGSDPSLADQIGSGPDSVPSYWVLYTELIVWRALTPYWRATIVHLPLPPTFNPGSLCFRGFSLSSCSLALGRGPSGVLPADGSLALGRVPSGVLPADGSLAIDAGVPADGSLAIDAGVPADGSLALGRVPADVLPAGGSLALGAVFLPIPESILLLMRVQSSSDDVGLGSEVAGSDDVGLGSEVAGSDDVGLGSEVAGSDDVGLK